MAADFRGSVVTHWRASANGVRPGPTPTMLHRPLLPRALALFAFALPALALATPALAGPAMATGPAPQAQVDAGTPVERPTRATTFVNFESTAVHPIRVSADGRRLYAVHTADARLAVYDLSDPARPTLEREVRVGLEPVSVTESATGEVWVANLLSDSVTVLDPITGAHIDTIRTEDEPSDVAFAGGRAFVACATVDRVLAFDAGTRQPVGGVDVPAKDPRAMAASADGTRVFVLSRRSGNGTTILPSALAPPQPPPTNPALPPAPSTGLIVRADEPAFSSSISYELPDADVFEVDAATLAIVRSWSAVGTTNYDVAVHPDGSLVVANTDARNAVRFEPELRGHVVDHRVTRVETNAAGAVVPFDLNPGVDYGVLPNPDALATSLAEPTAIVVAPSGQRAWVAAQGSERVAEIDAATGTITRLIEVGARTGAPDGTLRMRGPRGLALHPSGAWLYVFHRLSDTIGVIDLASHRVVAEVAVGSHDPVPTHVRYGRKFLYDARLSGNGTVSCAVCHVDGDVDGLAWDLGDPGGDIATIPIDWQQGFTPGTTPPVFPDLHPMKGPLVTQPLRGLDHVRMHWRGDKDGFADFNVVFDSLLGGQPLRPRDLDLFVRWSESVVFGPNPNQELDRSLSTTPPLTSQQRGFEAFSSSSTPNGPACIECHVMPTGSNGFVRNFPIGATQPMRIGPLRDFYRKGGFDADATGPVKAGFGRFHSGEVGELDELGLGGPGFTSAALTAFLEAWDTGMAPVVGREVVVTPQSAGTVAVQQERELLEERAVLAEVDLVAHGRLAGADVSYLFDPAAAAYVPARRGGAMRTGAELELLVAQSQGRLVLLAAPPSTGVRLGLDRDLDGLLDGDE